MGGQSKIKALTIDEIVDQLQPKLNMVGSSIDLHKLYTRVVTDKIRNLTRVIYQILDTDSKDTYARVLWSRKARELLLSDNFIYGNIRDSAACLNIKTIVVDITKVNKVEHGFMWRSGVEKLIFTGSIRGMDVFNAKLSEIKAALACNTLKFIYIPYGVKRLSCDVFEPARELECVSIPSSVGLFENGLFYYNSSLKEVQVRKRDKNNRNYIVSYRLDSRGNINWRTGRVLS